MNRTTILAITTFLPVIALWGLTPFLVKYGLKIPTLQEQGQFGDLYGSVNSLFSGLAFGGVILALSLQWRQIREQQEETATIRAIQQKTVQTLVNTMHARSFAKVYDILDHESVIAARAVVNKLGTVDYKEWRRSDHWLENEKQIKTLLRAYNIAGIIVRRGFLPERFVIRDWEPSLRSTWSTLEQYVRDERVEHGSHNHWPNYEWLAKRAERWANKPASKRNGHGTRAGTDAL
jgi:hypothetical protein